MQGWPAYGSPIFVWLEYIMLDLSKEKGENTLEKFIQREEIASIDLKFCDLAGFWHHQTLPANANIKKAFARGIGVDGSSIPRFAAVTHGDIGIIPDLRTGFIDPAFDRPCLSFICDVVNPEDHSPHPFDPRGVARRAEARLRGFGKANEIHFMPELEYYVFDKVEYGVGEDEAYWSIYSREGNPGKLADPGHDCDCEGHSANVKIPRGFGYTITPPMDAYLNLRDAILEEMLSHGLDVKYHHHEGGAYGQQEFELRTSGLVNTADSVLLGKYIIHLLSVDFGLVATFMPKPFPDRAGNGMHFHMRLTKNGKPVSYAKDGYAGLSKLAQSFIGGILTHGRALMAITSASTNSYRRLKPGHETPRSFFFSAANREAAIRIPLYAREPDEKRWEYRPSDATGNPYLSLAALLMAGLDGIERNIDPTSEGFGPFDGPGPILKRNPRNTRKIIPSSFHEALLALEYDHEFLLKGDVFSEDLIRTYIDYKLETDIHALQNHPHPYEFELYLNL